AGGLVPPAPETASPYSDAAKAIEDALRESLRSLAPGHVRRESFYATGAMLARLLDARLPSWQSRYFDPGSTLESLLEEAVARGAPPGQPTPWAEPGRPAGPAPAATPPPPQPSASPAP